IRAPPCCLPPRWSVDPIRRWELFMRHTGRRTTSPLNTARLLILPTAKRYWEETPLVRFSHTFGNWLAGVFISLGTSAQAHLSLCAVDRASVLVDVAICAAGRQFVCMGHRARRAVPG